ITVTAAGQTIAVPVTVALPPAEPLMSFRHEVMAVLSKSGCNMGACHGYSLGKNGFKLSLRGSDPELDFTAITKEQFGRRLNLQTPEASLLLAKPRGDAPHEGGVRFRRKSLASDILFNWIRQGERGGRRVPAAGAGPAIFFSTGFGREGPGTSPIRPA